MIKLLIYKKRKIDQLINLFHFNFINVWFYLILDIWLNDFIAIMIQKYVNVKFISQI